MHHETAFRCRQELPVKKNGHMAYHLKPLCIRAAFASSPPEWLQPLHSVPMFGPKALLGLLPFCVKPAITTPHDETLDTILSFSHLVTYPTPYFVADLVSHGILPRVRKVGIKPGETIVRQRLQRTCEFYVSSPNVVSIGDGNDRFVGVSTAPVLFCRDESKGKTRGIDFVSKLADGFAPVLDRRVSRPRPGLGEVRRKYELEEAHMAEAVGGDDFS